MRRIIVLLTVAALMAALMTTVGPSAAFAQVICDPTVEFCPPPEPPPCDPTVEICPPPEGGGGGDTGFSIPAYYYNYYNYGTRFAPVDPYLPTDPHRFHPTDPYLPTDPFLPSDPYRFTPTDPLVPTDPYRFAPTDPYRFHPSDPHIGGGADFSSTFLPPNPVRNYSSGFGY